MVYYMNDEINKPLFRVKHVSCTLNNIFSRARESLGNRFAGTRGAADQQQRERELVHFKRSQLRAFQPIFLSPPPEKLMCFHTLRCT